MGLQVMCAAPLILLSNNADYDTCTPRGCFVTMVGIASSRGSPDSRKTTACVTARAALCPGIQVSTHCQLPHKWCWLASNRRLAWPQTTQHTMSRLMGTDCGSGAGHGLDVVSLLQSGWGNLRT